jgi:5-(carboxyamino)imidazole ribonucleotide synthase
MRLGIIGGGQLGLYLCRAADELGIATVVLNPEADCPAASAAGKVVVGGFDDVAAAAELASAVDVVTFEIELVAPEVLQHLAARSGDGGPRVAPSPEIMLIVQNKSLQKQWLEKHGFPTPQFELLCGGTPDGAALRERFGLPLVQKAAVGGYDGRGVQILRTEQSLSELWPIPSLVETFVPNAREVAVLTSRGLDGSIATYAPTAMRFHGEANVLDEVIAPADLPAAVARRAVEIAEGIVTRFGGVGVFAVEMFVTEDDRVLVNEVSPRVHNSGHHTIEACRTSQFAQHVRAVAGLPLGPVEQQRAAVMKNVLYTPELENLCSVDSVRFASGRGDVFVHWYGKKVGRPQRKMGHITALAADVQTAERNARQALKALSRIAGEVFS